MISKELLSEVLGLRIYTFEYNNKSSNLLFDFDAIGEKRESSINIYELAHKCKEWAYKKGYTFQVRTGDILSCVDIFNSEDYDSYFEKQSSATTEPEAIFKATQWILDNLESEV